MNIKESINFDINVNNKRYNYNGKFVPRVTEILSDMDNPEKLNMWSNYLGFRRIYYKKELEYLAEIGTHTHALNELFILGKDTSEYKIPFNMKDKVMNAHNSFIQWYINLVKNNNIIVLGTEKKIVCEYYGGTYDLLISINNKTYLVDYKTSNTLSYKHFVQMSAYLNILRKDIQIDGCIILKLSKDEIQYTEYILSFDNINHIEYIKDCYNTFEYFLCSYYMKNKIKNEHDTIFNQRGVILYDE